MAITTAMCARYKADLLFGRHSHAQTRNFTGNVTSGSKTIASVSSLTGLCQGNSITNANFPAGTIIKSIDSASQITASDNATGSATGTTITATGDSFKIALIKNGMAGTYGASSNSYADITGNTDETSGTGYTAGGAALTNVDPVISSPSAYTNFSPDPSWTSASFSTAGCMIYNTKQNGDTANPACSVHDFGGTQTVSSGTFTAVMPVAAAATAILRIT